MRPEDMVVGERFHGEYVERSAAKAPRVERRKKIAVIHLRTATAIDDEGAWRQAFEKRRIHDAGRLRCQRQHRDDDIETVGKGGKRTGAGKQLDAVNLFR